jgi:hypothetical protein
MTLHPMDSLQGNDYCFPLIDTEFDRFELNAELEETLREAEAANFYHDALDNEY